ncbi:MAG: ABC transporter permease, partial [Pseudoclavibacter sp.]
NVHAQSPTNVQAHAPAGPQARPAAGAPLGAAWEREIHVAPWERERDALPLHALVEERYAHEREDGTVVRLQPVSARPPFVEYLRRLYRRRHFIRMQAWTQASQSNNEMILGNIWLIVAPLLDAAVYYVIFGLLFSRGDEYFILNLIVGIFFFTITSRMITSGAGSVVGNGSLIRSFSFPRASLPIATTVREVFSSVPVIAAMLVLIMSIPPHALPTTTWLLVPVIYALQLCFGLGAAFIMARLGSNIPDIRKLIPYLMRALFYGSAIFFTIDRYDPFPVLRTIVEHSPLYMLIEMYRLVLVAGQLPSLGMFIEFALWAIGFLVLGIVFFWRGEQSYGRKFR